MILKFQRLFSSWPELKTPEERHKKAEELLKLRKSVDEPYDKELKRIKDKTTSDLKEAGTVEGKKTSDGKYLKKEEILGREKAKIDALEEARNREREAKWRPAQDTTSHKPKPPVKKTTSEKLKDLGESGKKVYKKIPKGAKIAAVSTVVLGSGAVATKKIVDEKRRKAKIEEFNSKKK